ncbi:PIN domain-containing protein [Pseudomonas wadenswilerensis]
MPKGTPTAAQLWQGEVSFFSLDTDLIQSAGYKFDGGALKQLPKQLPDTMSLQLSEVVAQEIVSHRMEGIIKAVSSFKNSSSDLKRLAAIPMKNIDADFDLLSIENSASSYFQKQITDYVYTCQGAILPVDGQLLASRIFALYFESLPPFEKRQSKKSEFPDATSLILLEDFAKSRNTKGLIASGDEGWSSFADRSDYLYCVKSIDELAALFAATSDHAKAIEKKVIDSVKDELSTLRHKLNEELVEHVHESEWNASDIATTTVNRVEADVYDKTLKSYEIESAEVWEISDDKKTWVIELNTRVTIELEVQVEFFAWDSIDREEVSIDADIISFENIIDVEVYFTCSGVEESSTPENWEIEIEIAAGVYECEQMDIEPTFA